MVKSNFLCKIGLHKWGDTMHRLLIEVEGIKFLEVDMRNCRRCQINYYWETTIDGDIIRMRSFQ
jgi:hypothetical protein